MEKSLRIGLCVLLCMGVTACGIRLFYRVSDRRPELHTIAMWLVRHEYQEGYATFWNGPILTELTDNQIKIRAFGNGITDDLYLEQLCSWLYPVTDIYTMPEGKIFVLLSNEEACTYSFGKLLAEHYSDHVEYESTDYIIYGFQSYNEIEFIYEMDFQEGKWLANGTDNNGVRTLEPEGVSYGSYITLKKPASYQVTIKGTGLDGSDIRITADSGKESIPWDIVSRTDEELVIEFVVEELLSNVECHVENVSKDTMELKSIIFYRTAE